MHDTQDGGLAAFARRRLRLALKDYADGDNPWNRPVDRLRAECAARGRSFVSFANYDYLGLGDDPRVRQAAAGAALAVGPGTLGSRLVGGERALHGRLEAELADFVGAEASLVLVSTYLANASLVAHLVGPSDLVVADELVHSSLLAGLAASKARRLAFRHNDLDHLDALLEEHRQDSRRCLVLAEGLYSMEGDLPDLARLLAIKERHDAWLLLDEAHSLGVLGATGRGLAEEAGIDPARIDLIVGTLSKTFVSGGGFIAGRADIVKWLRFTLPGFVFSVGLAPPVAAAGLEALTILRGEPERLARLRVAGRRFLDGARSRGLDVGPSSGRAVVPVLFRDADVTMGVSQALLDEGIYCPPIVNIGVPRDMPRLRFFLSAAHDAADIDRALDVTAAACGAMAG